MKALKRKEFINHGSALPTALQAPAAEARDSTFHVHASPRGFEESGTKITIPPLLSLPSFLLYTCYCYFYFYYWYHSIIFSFITFVITSHPCASDGQLAAVVVKGRMAVAHLQKFAFYFLVCSHRFSSEVLQSPTGTGPFCSACSCAFSGCIVPPGLVQGSTQCPWPSLGSMQLKLFLSFVP